MGWLLTLLLACVDADAPVVPGDDAPFELEVAPGSTATRLTDRLEADGLVPSSFAWRWFLRSTDAGCIKAGRHEVRRSLSMRELLAELCGPPLPEDVPFTVVEGWRVVDIDAALVAKGWIEAGAYVAVATPAAVPPPFPVPADTLEGYLFPETYGVLPDRFDPADLVRRQLETFQARALPLLEGQERSVHALVTMASMIEREEPTPAQRPVVAGILWKRLDAGWKLGVDATSRYGLVDPTDRRAFLVRLRDPDDPFNTRLRQGLPPTPISNPGLASLAAAARPVASEFWYYLHDGQGVFHGGRDAAHHDANRRTYDVY
ncbi:MAG: endolytic transglycosylase MltG [Alphaproteobacteria bacterium]|nr:endolytic transglycosylase MltG [Alphaproteobacteria bacterium]